MTKKARVHGDGCGCGPAGAGDICRVDSMASIDARGQMVLRKELRERTGMKAGDQLAVVTWERDGRVCCISLMKLDELDDMVRQRLGPMMSSALASGKGGRGK
jgi:bifunctional DNA-binding transcriptional regulator/antitoxin component of YhaV-PrlF toxin-antitoxin module